MMLSHRIEQWAEGFIATGRKEGRVEGRVEGRLEGEARVLARQLVRRFGELPAWAEARLNAACEADLERWKQHPSLLDCEPWTPPTPEEEASGQS